MNQYFRNCHVSEPLVIGGYNVPGGVIGAAFSQHVLVCLGIFVPVFPLFEIRGLGLPVLCRVIKAFLETLLLLALADVQEKLDDV